MFIYFQLPFDLELPRQSAVFGTSFVIFSFLKYEQILIKANGIERENTIQEYEYEMRLFSNAL